MQQRFMQMNNQELSRFLQQGGLLVDIRRGEEWCLTGVIEGSLLLTFFAADGSSDPQDWLAQLNRQLPPDQPLALICRSGYRTGLIGEFLLEVTERKEIYHLTDGILGWLAEGFPVVTAGGEL